MPTQLSAEVPSLVLKHPPALRSLVKFRQEFDQCRSKAAKYDLCRKYAEHYLSLSETVDNEVRIWFETLGAFARSPAFIKFQRQDSQLWGQIKKIVTRTTEKQKEQAWETVRKTFGEPNVQRLQEIGNGATFAKKCAGLAARNPSITWDDFCIGANRAAFERIQGSRSGQTKTPTVITSDITHGMKAMDSLPLQHQDLRKIRARIDDHGLLAVARSMDGYSSERGQQTHGANGDCYPVTRRQQKARNLPEQRPPQEVGLKCQPKQTSQYRPRRCECKGFADNATKILNAIRDSRDLSPTDISMIFDSLQNTPKPEMCQNHERWFASMIGLNTVHRRDVLSNRIEKCADAGSNWVSLKHSVTSWEWFNDGINPDEIYAFRPANPISLEFDPRKITPDRIRQLLGDIDDFSREHLLAEGHTVTVQTFHKYIKSDSPCLSSIRDIARQELDLYRFHGNVDDSNYSGELHAMYHSITQQVLRMDICAWLLHMLSRGCKSHKLMAYPTPAWYLPNRRRPIEIWLHHPPNEYYDDQNRENHECHLGYLFLEGTQAQRRGTWKEFSNISKSREWWVKTAADHRLDHHRSEQRIADMDLEHFMGHSDRVDPQWFGHQPGTYAVVHAATPEVIGAIAPDDGYEGPAFVVPNVYVTCDTNTPEVSGACAVDQLRNHLINMTVPRKTPYGKFVACAENEAAWPVTYRLRTVSEIAGALTGEISWDHPAVLLELKTLFEGDVDTAQQRIRDWEQEMLQQARKALAIVQEREHELYDINSYTFRVRAAKNGTQAHSLPNESHSDPTLAPVSSQNSSHICVSPGPPNTPKQGTVQTGIASQFDPLFSQQNSGPTSSLSRITPFSEVDDKSEAPSIHPDVFEILRGGIELTGPIPSSLMVENNTKTKRKGEFSPNSRPAKRLC
ncbi:hypothetical protein NUU61_001328 [Penicillium alfredii]|uniref:Uncharacterized protein n=1 Tax=Penicillium alfredii TaxID=1506179 RepID=A0A9W9G443_9EURO|nr:uncharacterized protein NUU61_001328 [Penicillium alfredii]KAJ5111698.1 hypothetical protein NUU61_001328 [Penicillium alfredii]